jgi:hypothetical protein
MLSGQRRIVVRSSSREATRQKAERAMVVKAERSVTKDSSQQEEEAKKARRNMSDRLVSFCRESLSALSRARPEQKRSRARHKSGGSKTGGRERREVEAAERVARLAPIPKCRAFFSI